MKRLLSTLIVNALSLWVLDALMTSIAFNGSKALITAALVLGILNATVKPLLKVISLPITVLTFGLFSLVINALVLELTLSLTSGAYISGFGSALVGAILLAIVNAGLNSILGKD